MKLKRRTRRSSWSRSRSLPKTKGTTEVWGRPSGWAWSLYPIDVHLWVILLWGGEFASPRPSPTTYLSSEIHCLFMLFSSIVSWFFSCCFCCSVVVVVVFIVINISLPLAVRGGRNCVLFSYTCAPLCVCVCVRVSFCVCVRVYVSVEECSGIENGCVAAARNGVVYFNIAYFWAFYYIKL